MKQAQEYVKTLEERLNKIQRVLGMHEEFNPESPNYLRFIVKVKGLSGGQLERIQEFAQVLSIDAKADPYPMASISYPHLELFIEVDKELVA
jgi:hypothetical protein